jgi:hypothetical protein
VLHLENDTFMKKSETFILLYFILFCNACFTQKSVLDTIKASRTYDINYVDSVGKVYERGNYSSIPPLEVLFKDVNFEKKTSEVTLTGFTTIYHDVTDTISICCVRVFIAEPAGDTLKNIRYLGESHDSSNNTMLQQGFFKFSTFISKKDRLYFFEPVMQGTQEYKLGEILIEK